MGTIKKNVLNLRVMLSAIFLAAVSNVALSAPVTFVFEGELTRVPDVLSRDAGVAGAFSVGDAFTETITFESNTPDTDSATDHGFYRNALSTFEITIRGLTFAMDTSPFINQVIVGDYTGSPNVDEVEFLGGGVTDGVVGPVVNGYYATQMLQDFVQVSYGTTVLSTDALPTDIDVSAFISNRQMSMLFRNTSNVNDTGHLVGWVSAGRLQQTGQVPEPAIAALLGLGLAGVWAARKRRAS